MNELIETLQRAGDLVLLYGPDPEGCIRAAVYGRPDVVLPVHDTTESLLVEEAVDSLRQHVNPEGLGADEADTVDEWADGRSIADVRGALYGTAHHLEAGVR